MYVNSLVCVRIKERDNECFWIDNGVRQVCMISLWLIDVCMDRVVKEIKKGWERVDISWPLVCR